MSTDGAGGRNETAGTGGSSEAGWTGFGRGQRSPRRLALSLLSAVVLALLLHAWQPGWFAVPAVATIVGRVGAPAAGTANPATPVPSPVPTSAAQATLAHEAYIGRALLVDNLRVTLLGVRYTRGMGAEQANTGNIYAVVMVKFENLNHQGNDYSLVPNVPCGLPYCNFYLRDGQGEKNPPVPYDPYHTHMRAVVLQDGGMEQGSYTFEIPARSASTHAMQLLYYPSPLGDANNVHHWIVAEEPRRAHTR